LESIGSKANPLKSGGWASMATVDRYVKASQIANEGMAGDIYSRVT